MSIKASHKIIITLIVVILAFLLSCFIYKSDFIQKNYLYPFKYQNIIFANAIENNVSPYMIAGVIKAESNFKADVRSVKGARGLMQIMPETGIWIAQKINYKAELNLADPKVNILLGSWYLSYLKNEFNDNEVLYLAAYNAGIGNVKQWIDNYDWPENFNEINQIPFPETRIYVERVLYYKEKYQYLYGQ
ncbi:lytic transglycosylase domain-containing protein [Selenomonadales bacterium OttesenSCG-928-I06]|nr:lytic transglycosylase domain-containing protein [Selenomonadales bacterium OttesenSCG-928-I06]